MDRKFIGQDAQASDATQSFWLGRTLEARKQENSQNFSAPAPRHSVRRDLDLNVVINFGLTYSASWHVRDLSMTGAFIEMDATHLPPGAYVEVVLRYRYKEESIEQRLPATVARVEPAGVALTFGHYDDQTYTDLANLLYAA